MTAGTNKKRKSCNTTAKINKSLRGGGSPSTQMGPDGKAISFARMTSIFGGGPPLEFRQRQMSTRATSQVPHLGHPAKPKVNLEPPDCWTTGEFLPSPHSWIRSARPRIRKIANHWHRAIPQTNERPEKKHSKSHPFSPRPRTALDIGLR